MELQLEALIGGESIRHEALIVKNPDDLKLWLDYYRLVIKEASLEKKVFFLERAVRQFPRSYKLWMMYINLVLSSKAISVDINQLFERALQHLNRMPYLWVKYLDYLLKQDDFELTNTVFIRAFFSLPISQHEALWPLYLNFAEMTGENTEIKIYKSYVSFICDKRFLSEMNLEIEKIIFPLVKSGDWVGASEVFDKLAVTLGKDLKEEKIFESLFKDYFAALIELTPSNSLSFYIDSLIIEYGQVMHSEIAGMYLNCAKYYQKCNCEDKVRYSFEMGLAKCDTLEDFVLIYNEYTAYEEAQIVELSERIEQQTSKLTSELDYRMTLLEKLLNRRDISLNHMQLRLDFNNLDLWFERISIFKASGDLNKVLATYAEALSSVNPLKAYSKSKDSKYLLPNFWLNYSREYSERNDYKTANLVLEKSVQSQLKSPDDLAFLYIEWSKLHFSNGNEEQAVQILEKATNFPANHHQFDYADSSLSVQKRLFKSKKLWGFYLDLLESLIDNEEDVEKFTKVVLAYDLNFKLQIATPLTVIQFADHLELWNKLEDSLKVYERGIQMFKDWEIKVELWKIYLNKAILAEYGEERIRDLFEICLYGNSVLDESGCPPQHSQPVLLHYFQFEFNNGQLSRSLMVLKNGIEKLQESIASDQLLISDQNKLIEDEVKLYRKIISVYSSEKNIVDLRQLYILILQISHLKLYQIAEFAMEAVSLEVELGAYSRAREIYYQICIQAPPESGPVESLWTDWQNFESKHGNEANFKDLLRIRRSIKKKFEFETQTKDLNPMGFVKARDNALLQKEEAQLQENPDEIEFEM